MSMPPSEAKERLSAVVAKAIRPPRSSANLSQLSIADLEEFRAIIIAAGEDWQRPELSRLDFASMDDNALLLLLRPLLPRLDDERLDRLADLLRQASGIIGHDRMACGNEFEAMAIVEQASLDALPPSEREHRRQQLDHDSRECERAIEALAKLTPPERARMSELATMVTLSPDEMREYLTLADKAEFTIDQPRNP